jgi:hypothetical protein
MFSLFLFASFPLSFVVHNFLKQQFSFGKIRQLPLKLESHLYMFRFINKLRSSLSHILNSNLCGRSDKKCFSEIILKLRDNFVSESFKVLRCHYVFKIIWIISQHISYVSFQYLPLAYWQHFDYDIQVSYSVCTISLCIQMGYLESKGGYS